MKYVTVAYPNKNDAKFDFDYYMRKHIPMVSSCWEQALKFVKGYPLPPTLRLRISASREYASTARRSSPPPWRSTAHRSWEIFPITRISSRSFRSMRF